MNWANRAVVLKDKYTWGPRVGINKSHNWREMEKGIPTRAVIEPFKEIRRVCEQIVAKMNVQGPSNLQARITEKGVTVFEVNARFSGSTAVRCVAGFNGPDMAINNFLFGKEITDEDLSFTDLVEMRYKEEVFIERSDYENMLSKGGGYFIRKPTL